jgi:hypothetical protein
LYSKFVKRIDLICHGYFSIFQHVATKSKRRRGNTGTRRSDDETFEKCSILFKVKSKIPDFDPGEGENSNHLDNPSGQASIPLSISRIRI